MVLRPHVCHLPTVWDYYWLQQTGRNWVQREWRRPNQTLSTCSSPTHQTGGPTEEGCRDPGMRWPSNGPEAEQYLGPSSPGCAPQHGQAPAELWSPGNHPLYSMSCTHPLNHKTQENPSEVNQKCPIFSISCLNIYCLTSQINCIKFLYFFSRGHWKHAI